MTDTCPQCHQPLPLPQYEYTVLYYSGDQKNQSPFHDSFGQSRTVIASGFKEAVIAGASNSHHSDVAYYAAHGPDPERVSRPHIFGTERTQHGLRVFAIRYVGRSGGDFTVTLANRVRSYVVEPVALPADA